MQTINKRIDYVIDVPDYGQIIDISELIDMVKRSGSHFFDRDSMRFFKSRVDDVTFTAPDGWYFVTSEKHESAFARINEPRLYTVRCVRIVDRDNGTRDLGLFELEGFQAFPTLTRARTAARNAAKSARALCSSCRLRLSIDASQTVCAKCVEYAERHKATV